MYDTLRSFTAQSRTLGWIRDDSTSQKYLGYFAAAKVNTAQNNYPAVRTLLQRVVRGVNLDSVGGTVAARISGEAYALLRYNAEHLLRSFLHMPASGETE